MANSDRRVDPFENRGQDNIDVVVIRPAASSLRFTTFDTAEHRYQCLDLCSAGVDASLEIDRLHIAAELQEEVPHARPTAIPPFQSQLKPRRAAIQRHSYAICTGPASNTKSLSARLQIETQPSTSKKNLYITKERNLDMSKITVRLIETEEWEDFPSKDPHYVTLSHCWGPDVKLQEELQDNVSSNKLTSKNVDNVSSDKLTPKNVDNVSSNKLTSKNIGRMKEGIQLRHLPRTFQHAIEFAARLPDVGYIWIDSLCIKQGPEEISDWLRQSASMDQVYSKTYLNISATHAENGKGGLGVVEQSRLKGLEAEKDGKRLHKIRLRGFPDPDPHMQPKVYALELWCRIVEVYSKTSISKDSDKLVALSGMARMMAHKIGSGPEQPAVYAAGLWEDYLESQLLWQVEPIWRDANGTFENESETPDIYCAPSWSWASVKAEKANGIVCADITDTDLFIKVSKVSVTRTEQNLYGIVEERNTYIDLWAKLRKVVLSDKGKGRYGWHLLERRDGKEEQKNVDRDDPEEHTNVYLDCPEEGEKNNIFAKEHSVSRVYVIPAARGPRTASKGSKYITCLLVQHQGINDKDGAVFKRIGISRLSPWGDKQALAEILEVLKSDVKMPNLDGEYNEEEGTSKIRLV
ncbi:hypothetical protein E8E13_009886 [Curvularia kusanoi]|uniref:Heterokaryon incompatibility domain-containing protein n=1 Tax=Curvularia kusanoi TaxID=90978 RepID=A0A9P4TGN7_CURKU|nr:hypothetical protein E8E13_009886 [Curvularia kusanoi]